MSRSVLFSLVPAALLSACAPVGDTVEVAYPKLTLSDEALAFGEVANGVAVERTLIVGNAGCMPMGVGSIDVGDGDAGYAVHYDPCSIECPDGAAKAIDIDTGRSFDTGGATDTGAGACAPADGAKFVLDPGCQIPVTVTYTATGIGDAYDAVVVETVSAGAGKDGALPAFVADPIHTTQSTYLHAVATDAHGAALVRPRAYDYGPAFPGETVEPAQFEIANTGDANLTLTDVTLDGTCGAAFSFVTPLAPDLVLAPGESVSVDIAFAPTSAAEVGCLVHVDSDAPSDPALDVTLTANDGAYPNTPPTVSVAAPANGAAYDTSAAFRMVLDVSDAEQPPSTLACSVESATLLGATLADCTPTDDSGEVTIDIPGAAFDAGVDTLLVTVTDGSGATAQASVSARIDTPASSSDSDGDGYGSVGSAPVDCDDADPLTYPNATELYDLRDNDCDGIVDEGTAGSDDDGDGTSELEGDCDDTDINVQVGAPERVDGVDNDCNGIIDDHTSRSDDDGDGFAEVDGDCDDDDASSSPIAVEMCDGIDNDCDGLLDDGCIATEHDPIVAGDVIRTEQSALLGSETKWLDVLGVDADGEDLTYAWSTDGGGTFDDPTAPRVEYTAPAFDGGGSEFQNVYVQVADPEGNTDVSVVRLVVYGPSTDLYGPYVHTTAPEKKGCDTTGGSAAAIVGIAGAFAAALGRRRRG